MNHRRILQLTAVAATLASTVAVAREGMFFPIDQGWQWSYSGDQGGQGFVEIDGQQLVIGMPTAVRREVRTGAIPDSLENYWTVQGGHDVLLHGFTNFTINLSVSYDPPILLLDPPLFVGKSWATTTQPYEDLTGTVPAGAPFTIAFEVVGAGDVTVPAGTFFAYAVGFPPPADDVVLETSAGPLSVLGRAVGMSERPGDSATWYSAGVGRIQFQGAETFRLASFSPPATAIQPATWGRIKQTFGD